jgi:hypothetical protein
MRNARFRLWPEACALGAFLPVLTGCETLGSAELRQARPAYNEAVADTGRQQTLMNIVRIHNNQNPLIMEVIEVDQTNTFSGGVSGGAGNIGAVQGFLGSAAGSVSYSETPTIRLQPLQGQQLIQQVSSPITVDTLASLFNSDWPLASVFSLAVDRMTPDYDNYSAAIHILMEMDDLGAIELSGATSDYENLAQPKPAPTGTAASAKAQSTSSNSLNVYYVPNKKPAASDHLWREFLSFYPGTQPSTAGNTLDRGVGSRRIELRVVPRSGRGLKTESLQEANLAPVLQNRTGLGVLKSAVERPDELIDFIRPELYNEIRAASINSEAQFQNCEEERYYTLTLEQAAKLKGVNPEDRRYPKGTSQVINELMGHVNSDRGCYYSVAKFTGKLNAAVETLWEQLREYILIIQSNEAPNDAYAAWYDGTQWNYIAKDDYISQKNLMLINQFLTIQATQTPSPSLTTISVGGPGG